MKYQKFLKLLELKSDKKFAEFSKSLSNSDYISIGVKNPVLREIVKEHTGDKELKLEDFELGKYLEVDFVYFGLGVCREKTAKDKLNFLKANIHKAKSWAITDMVSTYLKKITFEEYWDFFLSLYQSKYTYDRRMAYVLGLKLYKDERILNILKYVNANEEYMVMMSEAWLLATISISFPNAIYEFLCDTNDNTLKRKTISKMVDSFRIDDETKEKFKKLRK